MNADEFLERAGPLLLADEPRHNLILGIAGTVRDRPEAYPDAAFWVVDGAAALRTRPYNLVLARPRDEAALQALVETIDDDLPGVSSPAPEAFDFARLWGRPYRVVQEHNVFALREVIEPRGVNGSWREATRDDLELLFNWWRAFVAEAIPEDDQGPAGDLEQIERRLDSDIAGFGLWSVDGEIVSLCGYGGRTPHGIRIGPVYTPPELRGHGYASALTAEVSQRLLDGGREFCFLYTDRANATANAIYERIGYRKVCEAAALAFE
jgi:predicted GNAT family acetyltransferase